MKKIAVIGMGYVGLISALVFADANENVICIDKNVEKIKMLKNQKMPFYEKGCFKLLKKNFDRLTFTSNFDMISNVELFFICVGTPLNSKSYLDSSEILQVVQKIKTHTERNKPVIICIRSTVLPGTCDEIAKNTNSPKIFIAHNPEFLSQGTAVKDFIQAKRIVIGSNDDYTRKKLGEIYSKVQKHYNTKTPIINMNTKESEMVKFVANSYLAMRLSFINEINNLCKIIGTDISKIIEEIKYDERIGKKYLKPGIGYGGSCLPKDTKALLKFSKDNNCKLKLVQSTIEINNSQLEKSLNIIKTDFPKLKNKNIALLGVTFKPNTDDIRNSCSLYLTDELIKHKAKINVYDPHGIQSYKKIYGNKVTYHETISKCILGCNIIIIATDWTEIKKFDYNNISTKDKVFIYDFKTCISSKHNFNSNIKYVSLGGKDYEK